MNKNDPMYVAICGDWHGNDNFAGAVIGQLRERLPDVEEIQIVHVGDFGVWPGGYGEDYLDEVQEYCEQWNARIWFIDGNHEDFTQLQALDLGPPPTDHGRSHTFCHVRDRIFYLRRGSYWRWHGRTWMGLGGAVSVDRSLRKAYVSWWPEEEITEGDHRRATMLNKVDVMITHDAPTSVPMSFGVWPSGWDIADKARSDAHRDRLQAVVDEVKPDWIFHGHYHRHHELDVAMDHGTVKVTGLDCDGYWGVNYVVYNVETMERVDV